MMNIIKTIFLGFLIACVSLVAEVLFELIAQIFFRSEIVINYSATDTVPHILFVMLIAASIEEIIRYIFIKKWVTHYINHKIKDCLLYGTVLGLGFVSLEIILNYFNNNTFNISTISFISVILTHVIISIFLLFISSNNKPTSKDVPFVIIAILLHVCANFILLQTA